MSTRRSNRTAWKQLFVAALVELDGSKFGERIVAAQNAIAQRRQELEVQAKRDDDGESDFLENAAKRLSFRVTTIMSRTNN